MGFDRYHIHHHLPRSLPPPPLLLLLLQHHPIDHLLNCLMKICQYTTEIKK